MAITTETLCHQAGLPVKKWSAWHSGPRAAAARGRHGALEWGGGAPAAWEAGATGGPARTLGGLPRSVLPAPRRGWTAGSGRPRTNGGAAIARQHRPGWAMRAAR